MTREDAKAILYEWQKSMVDHRVPIDTSKVQALRVAIEALQLMTPKDELICAIAKEVTYEDLVKGEEYAKGYADGLKEQLKQDDWIPCSERLPDIKEHHVSDPCLVYCENGAYGFAELEENIFGQVGWNCEREDEYHEPIGDVLAWMPLPKPYREDGEV